MLLPEDLSRATFAVRCKHDVDEWLRDIDEHVGGLRWVPVGNLEDNVHAIEVSTDPALALVERVTNAIDALLELQASARGATAPSPHSAARLWWGIPAAGLSEMGEPDRRRLADNIKVTLETSGDPESPTVLVQDAGCGVCPDDFPRTLLSLMASNKKTKHHLMGVYNAGGAATYKWCKFCIIASRRNQILLDGRPDEVGMTVVRYNPLDTDQYKTGTYQYCVHNDGSLLRLQIEELPELPFGTYVKHISYDLPRYASMAHGPKSSLWHLLHAALFDPPLPVQIRERRADQYAEVQRSQDGEIRRVVSGLRHLLGRPGISSYSDERTIGLGPESGAVVLRYWVLADSVDDPDAYVRYDQALTLTHNGQRQGTRDRQWLRRNTDLHFLFRRLIVQVDCNSLTNAAKREVFAATRESQTESKLTQRILDRVVDELQHDDELSALDERQRDRAVAEATKRVSAKVKRQLAKQIAAAIPGTGDDARRDGRGSTKKQRERRKKREPRVYEDGHLPEVPDFIEIVNQPLKIQAGHVAVMRVRITAKNGFLPRHRDGFKVIIGPQLKDHVSVRSTGSLLGGETRVVLGADPDSPRMEERISVVLAVESMGVMLPAESRVEVLDPVPVAPDQERGGEPDIDIQWIGRDRWQTLENWDELMVGDANVKRDPQDRTRVTSVEFLLNEAFGPFESVGLMKKLTEVGMNAFRDAYTLPVCWALFQQTLFIDGLAKPPEAAARDTSDEKLFASAASPEESYLKSEKERLARAVLMAMEPELSLLRAAEE